MDLGLAGKTAIVTGGGSNIGRAIVLCLAREGANVVIADLDEPQGQKVAEEARNLGAKAMAVVTDVTDWDQVQATTKKTLDEFNRIDVLVNNVGWQIPQLFMEETLQKWDKVIDLNYKSMIYCTRAILDQMIKQKSGAIVSIGSDAGRTAGYREGVYGGCKAAVISLTRTLALELGPYGIRLNVVCPALTPARLEETGEMSTWRREEIQEMLRPEVQEKWAKKHPLLKLGKAEDIAFAVLFLASDRAGHITGQTISVSGGITMV